MTIQELNKILAESDNKSFYDSLTLTISYPHIAFQNTFVGVGSIYEFLLRQVEGFGQLGELPSELNDIKKTYENSLTRILNLLNSKNYNKGEWDNSFSQIIVNRPVKFLFDSPETLFLLSLYNEKRESYLGAIEYFNGNLPNISNKQYFIGYLMAYEFQSKSFSEIVDRKGKEKKTLETLRLNFQKLHENSVQTTQEYIRSSYDKFNEYSKLIDQLKTEKEGLFNSWFANQQAEFTTFFNTSTKSIKELEDLYLEKLKLEAPARYWRERAKKLRREGITWVSLLFISVGLTVFILLNLLSGFSDNEFSKIFSNTGTAIKWSILLITIISFLAFAIKSFSKLAFSSFHLMRDAEEKEQLTYVYLALTKEKGIDLTERHLVMQSLFSRADTGLLKDDASPTMPGNILDKALAAKP